MVMVNVCTVTLHICMRDHTSTINGPTFDCQEQVIRQNGKLFGAKNNADNKDDAQETLSATDANASTRQSESSSSDGSTSSSSDEDEIDELTQRRGTKLNAFLTEKPRVSSPTQSKEMILGIKYLVEIPESGSIGISWETNWEGKQTIVKSFHRTDGKHGDAKLSGKVDKQDILIAINGVDVTEKIIMIH